MITSQWENMASQLYVDIPSPVNYMSPINLETIGKKPKQEIALW